jgi:hypothetical protein
MNTNKATENERSINVDTTHKETTEEASLASLLPRTRSQERACLEAFEAVHKTKGALA